MDWLNVARKVEKIKFYIGMTLVGLLFAVVGGLFAFQPQGEYAPVTVEITQKTPQTVDEETLYDYNVSYEVEGVPYTSSVRGWKENKEIGDTLTLEYSVDNPMVLRVAGGDGWIMYLVFGIGCVLVVLGIVKTVASVKKKVKDMNEFDQVDETSVDPALVQEIRESTEPMQSYVFHFDGKLNQGYVMEDSVKRVVYEAKMEKITVFKPYTFEFINHLTGYHKKTEISHTVTTSIGSGSSSGFSYAVPTSSSFKVDGVNVWKVLASKGFGFDHRLSGLRPIYDIKRYGVPVAHVETAGTNAMRGGTSKIGNLPVNGIFNVTCRESDLDGVFLTCFAIARVDIYTA